MVASEAAEAAEVSDRTCRKWVRRYEVEGDAGLLDHSSAPRTVHNRTDELAVAAIAALRRLRFTGAEIAEVLDRALSTVSGILTRIGMGRLGLEPETRYERQRPGELIHIDVKKLGRILQPEHRITGDRRSRCRTGRGATRKGRRRLGVRAHRDRRRDALGVRRAAGRREGHDRHGLPWPRDRVL